MARSLTQAQVDEYQKRGFLKPVRVISEQKAAEIRSEIEALEAAFPQGSLPKDLNQYFRVNGQMVLPFMAQVPKTPAILDAVESILGSNLLIWSVELFIKEPGATSVVSWHQDLTYWGLGGTDHLVSAWIALTNVNQQAGCMRFVPESHHQDLIPHKNTFSEDNLLSRGQELAVDVDENDAVLDELKPGEMSLHHGRMFHASGPNRSDDRRIGMVVRYVTPEVKQLVGQVDYAMMARGMDAKGNWIHLAPPQTNFGAAELALYDQVLKDQTTALAAGASDDVSLYTAS